MSAQNQQADSATTLHQQILNDCIEHLRNISNDMVKAASSPDEQIGTHMLVFAEDMADVLESLQREAGREVDQPAGLDAMHARYLLRAGNVMEMVQYNLTSILQADECLTYEDAVKLSHHLTDAMHMVNGVRSVLFARPWEY